ncbi:MAG: type II toxin-antitoxin system HicB family antitoxin [Rhodospirillaceae bacterium]
MQDYPFDLTPDDNDTLLVTSPDFPELTSFGDNREDALIHAAEALTAIIETYMERGLAIPPPGPAAGQPTIRLSTLTVAKVVLYNTMRVCGVSQLELASRLGCDPRQIRRMLDLRNASRMDRLDAALAVLGKCLSVDVRDAA